MKTLWLSLLVAMPCLADDLPTFAKWEDDHQFDCNCPYEKTQPEVKKYQGWTYEQSGATVKVRRDGKRKGGPVLGVLAGVKDLEPDTQATLKRFLDAFEKEDVDVILIGGDAAEEPEVLDKIYGWLTEATGRPLLAVLGNTERAGAHNYAIAKLRKAGKFNLLNADVARRTDFDGFDVVSAGGYYDKKYLHLSGGCIYTQTSLDEVVSAAKDADDVVVYLGHGPPKQTGKNAIDYANVNLNVGDPQLNEVITKGAIPFGVFGHILEAGARATDLKGNPVPQKKLLKSFYFNPGSANPLPWKLNDGTTSYGLAGIIRVQGKQASYEVLRAPKPPPAPAE